MIPDRPTLRFNLTWLLLCAMLLLLSYIFETLIYSGLPNGGGLLILALSYLTEMARYVPLIAICGFLISYRRTAFLGLAALLIGQYMITEYRYTGVEGLNLYGLQIVNGGTVSFWGHTFKAVYPVLSLLLSIVIVRPVPYR